MLKIILIVALATLKLSCFCLRDLKIIAFSQVFGHSVHFVALWPSWHGKKALAFIFNLLPQIVRPFSGDTVMLCTYEIISVTNNPNNSYDSWDLVCCALMKLCFSSISLMVDLKNNN